MKRKLPVLAFVTRHDLRPPMTTVLSGYEIVHIRHRALSPLHMIDAIKAACYPDAPNTIAAIMPARWRLRFVQACREKFDIPGVTVVRPVMYGEHWHGYFYCMRAPKGGFFANQLLEKVWIPNGPNVDLARRLAAKALAKQALEDNPAARGIRSSNPPINSEGGL